MFGSQIKPGSKSGQYARRGALLFLILHGFELVDFTIFGPSELTGELFKVGSYGNYHVIVIQPGYGDAER